MTLRRAFTIGILITGLAAGAHAQTMLTLEQLLHLARENSPALRAADNAIRSSELAWSELSTTAFLRSER